ncbi:lignostilbene dioxygenase family [Pyrenophora seminiperda CCB06]|uniref:Lignostilbene dioxygenase family n=1 Tax=Pyrenophora seminiperda CCB06 TaxID=1302712 RepID=A0A3M7M9U2_9PLEO|nr:lignostilbene dioxygenase family [Pyrenophora seminiperda CCB06]
MFKKTGLLLLAAAACCQADFMVYTEPPIPTSAIPTFSNPSDASSWTTSVFLNAKIAYGRFTASLGAPYQSSLTSARSEIDNFVKTATNYSIPAEVTMADQTPTYFSKPNWYTALPSAARAFKEQQVQDQFSVVRSVIAARQTTATSTGAAVPTAHVQGWLGAEFGIMAAAAAAAFL